MLKAINSALETIRIYQPAKTHVWLGYLEKVAGFISTADEFMACGRIFGWLCGLAHLRARAAASYSLLPPELRMGIRDCFDPNTNMEEYLEHYWPLLNRPEFVGEAGGFAGFGGPFIAPPLVSLIENEFLVTDHKSGNAFFADSFGKVFLTEIAVSPFLIAKNAGTEGLKNFRHEFGSKLFAFDDITSAAARNNTLVLTRSSSHYLYVYGYRT
jgi:hypothetical protein